MTTLAWLAIAFVAAFGTAFLLTPVVIRSAGALKLYDSPDGERRMHDLPVPRLGGIAVYLAAAAVACLVFIRAAPLFVTPGHIGDEQIRFLTGIFLGSALLFLAGLVDDVRGLSPGAKSVAQIAAAAIAWYFGARLGNVALGYGEGVRVGILEFPLLMLWIVGVTNAFNFTDGLNGLAGGIAVVACATILIVGLALGNFAVLLPTVALGGALLAFLRFNYPSARIFLGDSGSMPIGFLLAVMSVHASVNSYGAVLVIVPILAVSVPLLDGSLAIIRRWLRKVPLSGADARHIHHRLLALGVSQQRAALILWTLAAAMAGFGLLIALTAPFVAASIAILGLVGVAVLLIYGTNLLSYHELIVAGEVLMSAPSRARRLISDQILALDLIALVQSADNVEEVADTLSEAAGQFGFLAMELSGESLTERAAERIPSVNWAWKLDYPVRLFHEEGTASYVLSIWCSPETSMRPYGAERVAKILGPALQQWFETGVRKDSKTIAEIVPKPVTRRKLRVT
ncbi:MAG: MraY family glycosyltransferase [Gemmatimonadales bacterium]